MITELEKTLQEMKTIYRWSNGTYKLYQLILNQYTIFQGISFNDLIIEAETEEQTIHKPSKRRIKKRLIQYQIHLQEQDKTPNTIKNYLAKIVKVYRYLDIEVPLLPPVRNNIVETFDDIPTREEIQKAILHSRTKMKAIITFIASSGLRRSDVANLRIGDFFKATRNYHKANNIIEFLLQLEKQEIVIPEWHITSQKTGIKHITFSSHESTLYIIQMLKERLLSEELELNDLLFDVQPQTISKNFKTINTKLGFGWKQTRRKFHPHALRKYFATTLTSNDMDFLTTEFLLGHTLSSVQQSYYYANPGRLRNKYLRVMCYLSFTMEVSVVDVDSREKRELLELRKYRRSSDERIRRLEELVNLIH